MKLNSIKTSKYNLEIINVDNFRSSHVSIIFRNKFDRKKAVAFCLLSDMLTDASKDYPSSKYVLRHLEDNYILDFYGSFSRSGNVMQTYIVCDYINSKYIKQKDYLDNVYKFIFNMLKKPLAEKNKFDEKLFNLAKNRMLKDCLSYGDDNVFLSMNKALKIFDADSATSFHLYDMIDFIKNITNEELFKYYEELIKESSIDIFVTTDEDKSVIEKLVKKYYPFNNKKYKKYNELIVHSERFIPKKVFDISKYKQSTVVMIFNVNNMSMREREFVMPYYLNILNTSGLNSKLYRSLRNENSLCYNVQTSCVDRSNILIVRSTITAGEEKKAIRLIKKCFKEMKHQISDEEFVRAYYAYQSSLKGMIDNIGAINRLYMNKYYAGFSDYEEKKKAYQKIKIYDIYNLANKVKLNTIYVLKGDKNERNQD